jgi:hypothetical protein
MFGLVPAAMGFQPVIIINWRHELLRKLTTRN